MINVSSNNRLEKELEEYKIKKRNTSIFVFIFFILFIPTGGLTFIPFVIAGILNGKYSKKFEVLKSGVMGERKSNLMFQDLSNDFYLLSNLKIEVDNKVSEIDNIIIGSNGIFIIETKNLNGKVVGNEKDNQIIQHKVGRKGGNYSKNLYNPIKQVGTHVYRLSSILKKYNFNIWIQGVVYFSNEECKVCIDSDKIPVFSAKDYGKREILNYINNYSKGNLNIKEEDKIEIINIIKRFAISEESNDFVDYGMNNNPNLNRNNDFAQEDLQRFMQENQQREFEEFSRESVTSFDEGGFVQGSGFNLSDTMNDMNDI